jgi:hypothetical protein
MRSLQGCFGFQNQHLRVHYLQNLGFVLLQVSSFRMMKIPQKHLVVPVRFVDCLQREWMAGCFKVVEMHWNFQTEY